MTGKHWDIKRSKRENWTAADYAMHKFFKHLPSRGHLTSDRVWLFVYNAQRPSKSVVLTEAVAL